MKLDYPPSQAIVEEVIKRLKREYGMPRHGNPRDPLDDLFFIILSNKTSPESARSAYRSLKKAFKPWAKITPSSYVKLKRLLKPAGLGNIRAAQILGIVEALRANFKAVSLRPLKEMTEREAESFLVSLPGVSLKVAKCVMMYVLGHQVLPVDSHVHRISVRLGWTDRKRADQCHEELESIIPGPLRFAFHVCCISHGRLVCRPRDPLCEKCALRGYCAYYAQQEKCC